MHDDLNTKPEHEQDPAVRGVIAGLDRLVQADRAEPDAEFERRLASAARPGVAASIGPDAAGPHHRRLWWALPIAAAIAFAAIIIIPASRTSPGSRTIDGPLAANPTQQGVIVTVAMLEAEFEDFLFVDEFATSQAVTTRSSVSRTLDASQGTDDDTTDEIIFDLLSGVENSL